MTNSRLQDGWAGRPTGSRRWRAESAGSTMSTGCPSSPSLGASTFRPRTSSSTRTSRRQWCVCMPSPSTKAEVRLWGGEGGCLAGKRRGAHQDREGVGSAAATVWATYPTPSPPSRLRGNPLLFILLPVCWIIYSRGEVYCWGNTDGWGWYARHAAGPGQGAG